ncbi:MAG: adenylate/guanylate cyclase domain-containing protein [Deltaproteobacteria bacterium]|uniref:adenylate/guanylate cyclase domain-containing protein n=1 Tax=Desulfobacula sp. TaxID=2593537 RepID=UPI0019ADA290|nr:adenylate/guanylate cyclase domain-containing protein [Candidatus Desulfobacula maris]MBL6993433.1 adenylate/guanylate cyclase domain-containing protein [Desulfobacula sp.]
MVKKNGVRIILLMGVFWRILFIEAALLVFSLFYKWVTEDVAPMDLFWYGVRIIIMVGIIIAFMMITLEKFLNRRIITPLEKIAKANKNIQEDMTRAGQIEISDDAPDEIKSIVTSRGKMLETILSVSDERLNLVNFIRETFGRYLSNKVVDEILESPKGRQIGGTRKTITVLMADLRGFTSLSETKDPEEMVQLLNRFLEKMSVIIHKYEGIIDEIIGDAILAIFGAPESHDNDPERAVACALEMQNSLIPLNNEIIAEGYPSLEMGIGINTGTVIVGNIGSELRMKYGIVGAAVNTAARIESNSIGGQVLVGESTYDHVREYVKADPAQTAMMKGMKKPLVFYSVFAIESRYNVLLQSPAAGKILLPIKLPFQCWKIKDKKIDLIPLAGETIRMDDHKIDAHIPSGLEAFTDIMLRFDFCLDAHCFEDIYAKSIPIEKEGGESFNRLQITSMDPKDKSIIKKWMIQGLY